MMRRSLVTLAAVAFIGGCGYRFTAPAGPLPLGIKAVHAPVFQNATGEPSAEVIFTQAFREQLSRAGTLGDASSAARVEGTVASVTTGPMVASAGKLPSYRLSATVTLSLLKDGATLSSATVQGDEDVPSGADVLLTDLNRQAGLRRLASTMMRDGYERLCTGW